MNYSFKKHYNLLLTSTVLVAVTGCGLLYRGWIQKHTESRLLLGTIVKIDACYAKEKEGVAKEAFKEAWQRMQEINQEFSEYNQESAVSAINAASGRTIKIPADLYNLIEESKSISQQTKGSFDITVLPLIALWKNAAKENQIPSKEKLADALKAVGYQNIELLKDNQIRLKKARSGLALGGIAKGYAVDEAVRVFRKEGFENFLIDAGGDLYAAGLNCQGEKWRIGIRDPRDATRIIDILDVSDQAVTTSGDYEQYFLIKDKRFSHIINPLTGYPQEKNTSVTVIAPQTFEADALATALSVLKDNEGLKLIDGKAEAGYAAVIYEKDENGALEKRTSKGYDQYRR